MTQLFKTYERTLQFISFIMISQTIEDTIKANLVIPDNFKTMFAQRFQVLNLGDYIWLIKSLGNMMKKQKLEGFIPEISANFTE